ncbi:hypothetical protein [Streptomyces gilvus]|uniref:hypothetical protein n=1 Tax=Streptomyces gilvus TaxID=2920937 RepID=UPI001F0D9077|nr:hypothetical protein [Streptomyces sp. CME 23]MCH5672196.1 hypothetical protein [Streptomyces sp. CME 23]
MVTGPVHGAELVARLLARPGRVVSVAWLNARPRAASNWAAASAVVSLVVDNGRFTRSTP